MTRRRAARPISGDDANVLQWRLAAVAVLILMFSLSVLAHNVLTAGEAGSTFTVNGVEFQWEAVSANFTLIGSDGRTGYSLSALVNSTGLEDPMSSEYRIVGADGYQKTVSWEDMLRGILQPGTKETYFPTLPKQYYVHDVVEIEVI